MKAAFTIATANYLAQAKAVADSFRKVNSDYEFIIFLLDKINNRFEASSFHPVQLIEVEKLNIECFGAMLHKYSIFELSNALKPFAASFLFERRNVNHLIYFDSDILIYNCVQEVEEILQNKEIVITPHFLSPVPLDGMLLEEKDFLNAGIYNGGFFALKNCKESVAFLQWWQERMRKYCLVDFSKGLFVDQIWLNLVPIYFKNVHIISSLGYNVAYWNLHERVVVNNSGQYIVNNHEPLVFYHYSGFDFNQPDVLSIHQNRYSFESRPDIVPLFKEYLQIVMNNNYRWYSKLTCHYQEEKQMRIERPQKVEVNRRRYGRFLKSIKWLLKKFLRIEVTLIRNK